MTNTKFNPWNDYLRAKKLKEARQKAKISRITKWRKELVEDYPDFKQVLNAQAKARYHKKKNETTN